MGRPADTGDLKAAISFVPTHLRTKKLPATAKTQEGPSISRVSAYSMGTAALGRQVGGAKAPAAGEAVSGLARFLGEAKKQQEGAGGAPKQAGPADLDREEDISGSQALASPRAPVSSSLALFYPPGERAVAVT
ncbi:hypothetical protein cyc_07594 [Cyclospora cayetanensis]|uniref:Uncharacterized protein n=1 Tax=Cyclospora cayetanensis TaxID=88456 RepID=A0A1D3CV62_9EIME|nr:hypothetical protein cyc_07594 [Cyclospora cayetanensis]